MKKILLCVLCLGFACNSIGNVKAEEIPDVKVTNNIVTLNNSGKELTYDVENGILSVEDMGQITITTEVIDDNLTEKEKKYIIELDKRNILEYYENLEANPILTRSSYSASGIPANAPVGQSFTLKKDISEIAGDLGDILDVISEFTGCLAFCPVIPYSAMMATVSTATKMSSSTLQALSANLKGGWTYKLQVTKYAYQVGITTQTGSRYCQVGVDIDLNILGKRYDVYTAYAKTGGWWVSQKPF